MEEPLQPMEPIPWPTPFDDPLWQFEIKWDGVRCLAYSDGRGVRLYGRRGTEWTDRFGSLVDALRGAHGVFDGEIVVLEGGKPSFPAVMRRLRRGAGDAHYMVFDCLEREGKDVRGAPLTERQALLPDWSRASPVHRVDAVRGAGKSLFEMAAAGGLEGVVAKRCNSAYHPGKNGLWRKTKCWRRITCLVLGLETAKGDVRSVILGEKADDGVYPIGSVGGLGGDEAVALRAALAEREVVWVDVAYIERTATGTLRHPRFLGIAHRGAEPGGEV